MYIARHRFHNRHLYTLRTSYVVDGELTHRDILDLGPDPAAFIEYAGTNAFYFKDILEQSITKAGLEFDTEEIEDLFWPWIRPDIRLAVETFRHRSSKPFQRMTPDLKKQIKKNVNAFDKRRAHFLKFGRMDQGRVENMPPVLFKGLVNKSRDEIEQTFLLQETILKPHELKSYVYVIFDLQRFFQSFMAKRMPHVLDQEKVDDCFIKELCRINRELFNTDTSAHPYLSRYVIMFYDYLYADSTLLDDFARAFMNRHRAPRTKPPNPVSASAAMRLFDLDEQKLSKMSEKELTRIYRKKARKVHPDAGGSDKAFIELNNAFNALLETFKK